MTKIIAHRGYSGSFPENTLLAFEKAIEAGCGLIEFDVQLSKDGVPFVIHDGTLDRTTSGHGRVADGLAREISSCSAGYAVRFGDAYENEQIPTLDETLAALRGRAQLLIEIKAESVSEDRDDLERAVVDLLREHDMIDQARAISFVPLAILRARRIEPALGTGFLVSRDELGKGLDKAVEAGAGLILYHRSQIDRMKVEMVHARGLQCGIYNVDDAAELSHFFEMGLDAIGSNYPGEMLRHLERAGYREVAP